MTTDCFPTSKAPVPPARPVTDHIPRDTPGLTHQFHYDSDLLGGSLMIRESRIIARLLRQGVTPKEWNQAIRVDNVLQKRSPASAIRNARTIRQRLEQLTPEFWKCLAEGDDELATQVALCGALERNLLLVEFMETVLSDDYKTRSAKLDAFVWSEFLDERAQRDPDLLDWRQSTRKKTGQVAYRILAESGYLKNTRGLELQRVVVRSELIVLLDDNSMQRIRECLLVSL